MLKCEQCNRELPDELVDNMFENGRYVAVDPVCALMRTRVAHGAPDYVFGGRMARQKLVEGIRHYKEMGWPLPPNFPTAESLT